VTGLTIVLPTFNERETIVSVLDDLLALTDDIGVPLELLVVDDSSPDGTAQAVIDRFGPCPGVRVHARSDRGLASAVRDGIDVAKHDGILLMDTDGNHDPRTVPALVRALANADLSVGSRFVPGGGMPHSRSRQLLSRLFNAWACTLLRLPVHDCLSGFLCFRRRVLESLDTDEIFTGYGDYAIRLLHAVDRHGGVIVEIPAAYGPRRGGESKTRFVAIFARYFASVMRLWRHERAESTPRR
jgi:dolichol-phosphate mannosyltransferase